MSAAETLWRTPDGSLSVVRWPRNNEIELQDAEGMRGERIVIAGGSPGERTRQLRELALALLNLAEREGEL